MPADTTSLGGYLRQEREHQHVSLHDISAATKIQLRFLEALEKDEYESLPPSPFVVGFLRAYAQCLHVDSESIITTYRALQRPSAEDSGPLVSPPLQTSGSSPIRVRLGVISIVVLLAAFVFVLAQPWRHQQAEQPFEFTTGEGQSGPTEALPLPAVSPSLDAHREKSVISDTTVLRPTLPVLEEPKISVAEKRPTMQTESAGSTNAALVSGVPSITPSSGVTAAAAQSPPPLPPTTSGKLVLRAEATTETWLRVKIDGEKSRELLLGTGKDVSWEAAERFLVTIGNARGTRLLLNGQEVKLPVSRNNVIRDLVVTRETPH